MRVLVLTLAVVCCFAAYATAEDTLQQQQQSVPALEVSPQEELTRNKRTIFLKKKLLGAGLLGLGLGVAKGVKLGYLAPHIEHVHLPLPPPPPVRYIEYVEKPVFVQRLIEKPFFKHHHDDYEPAPSYGSW